MSGEVTRHAWNEKPGLSGHLALGLTGAVVLVFTYFKLRPYFTSENKVHPYQGQDQADHRSVENERKDKELKDSILTKLNPIPHFGVSGGHGGGGATGDVRSRVRIIERPLFDGLAVTIRAVLTRGISSLEPDPRIEARYESLVKEEETANLDDSSVVGAKLMGAAIPNLDLKRMVLNFGELVTRDGRAIPVQATAIDAETQTQGVEANYASGLGTRLLGVGISQVMTAGDQVLMAKILLDRSEREKARVEELLARAKKRTKAQAATKAKKKKA